MERNEDGPAGTAATAERLAPDKDGRPDAKKRPGSRKMGGDGENVRRFQESLNRIRMVTGTRTQVELATVLEIRQSSVSDACRRSMVPPQWYLTLLVKLGVNPLWVEHGTV